ncbi:MAG TPA: hydroxyethylthiazole kinase [Gemmatimonas sp.]|uniref:hydroxyethylthiazole kinase n=1 Tax=Gemmatimonas sp. TaxID=1962908 RepID=UPI002EDA01AB
MDAPVSTPPRLSPADALAALRASAPLTQCITNYVAMQMAANTLLAAGAAPAMIHTVEESGAFAGIARAVTINIGTLSPAWVDGMKAAIDGATAMGTPWVLDPVAHYASAYRASVARDLLSRLPTILRGNASEILALAGGNTVARGVDAADPVTAASAAARALALEHGSVVAVTGPMDLVTDGTRVAMITGGSPWMPQVTALGCSLTCLMGAFAAVAAPLEATVGALVLFAEAGARAHEQSKGPGSFAWRFLDALAAVTPGDLTDTTRVSWSAA